MGANFLYKFSGTLCVCVCVVVSTLFPSYLSLIFFFFFLDFEPNKGVNYIQ